jgi:hypothetical protein
VCGERAKKKQLCVSMLFYAVPVLKASRNLKVCPSLQLVEGVGSLQPPTFQLSLFGLISFFFYETFLFLLYKIYIIAGLLLYIIYIKVAILLAKHFHL